MNPFLIILGLIILFMTAVFTLLSFQAMKTYRTKRSTFAVDETSSCYIAPDQLKDVSGSLCCYRNGEKTGSRLLDLTLGSTVNVFSVNPVPTPYLDVCSNLCKTSGSSYVLSSNELNIVCNENTDETTLAQLCVDAIKPKNCIGDAMPVAVIDSTFYYLEAPVYNLCTPGPC